MTKNFFQTLSFIFVMITATSVLAAQENLKLNDFPCAAVAALCNSKNDKNWCQPLWHGKKQNMKMRWNGGDFNCLPDRVTTQEQFDAECKKQFPAVCKNDGDCIARRGTCT